MMFSPPVEFQIVGKSIEALVAGSGGSALLPD